MVDRPYEAWEVFEKVAIAFNNGIPLFDVMQQPSPQACAFTVDAMNQIRTKKYSDEVDKYLAGVFLDNGIVHAPDPVTAANEHIRKLLHPEGLAMAGQVESSLKMKKRPHMNSSKPADIQLAKSLSVVDYVSFMEKRLYSQLQRVFKEN